MDASRAVDDAGPVPVTAAATVGLPATEIVRLVHSGAVPALDVVRAHLDHIDAGDARLGPFRAARRDAALAAAPPVGPAPTRFPPPPAAVPPPPTDPPA